MSSILWKHDTYTNPNIAFLFNKEIIEYDMKDAGFSLTREYNLLDDKTITKLSKYEKNKRKVTLGKIQRDDKEYRDSLKESFKLARKEFIESNNIEDNDIIAIKKDAIFVKSRCKHRSFGNFIEFRPKNTYTSYIQLGNKGKRLEFYYNIDVLDIKGISEENYSLHQNYMIKFIKSFFLRMETEDNENVIKFAKRFIDRYKRKELEVGYYRTFDYRSIIELIDNNEEIYKDYWEDKKADIDISYNFYNILLKLIQIPL